MTKSIVFLIGCVLLSFSLIPAHIAHAATFDVCTLGELTTAITTANTNTQADTINFNCSTTLNVTSEFTLLDDGAGNGITINSNGNTVIFDGGGSTRFFLVNTGASLTLNGLTLQNGNANDGGAIRNTGALTVLNSTFTNNSATVVGGAIITGNTAIISNSTFTGNSSNNGGAIYNVGAMNITDSTFLSNSTANVSGGAVHTNGATAIIQNSIFKDNLSAAIRNDGTMLISNTYYENNPCNGAAVTDNGGNTVLNAPFCPGTAPVVPIVIPVPTVTVLGCALDTADGVEVANAPDDTYCRVLMRNGGVVSYSGAIPAQLINLGVILAVDVYRLEGGRSISEFPNYARVCLAGEGRLFYMDSRNAPRVSIELASENVDGLTCGWIPAPGTLILTN